MTDKLVWGGENLPIQKKVLHAGKGEVPAFGDGTKITFHYQTRLCDDDHTVVDDSRSDNKPLEIMIGKKFKMEVWETCLKTMRLNEVASFVVKPTLLGAYPTVAKNLRDIRKGKPPTQSHGCCGMALREQSLGYTDLDQFVKAPSEVEFIFELTSIVSAGEYEKESWAMDETEKLAAVPLLKEEGNRLYQEGQYSRASEKYAEALGIIEQLLLREKPHDDEWNALDTMKIPFLLNFSQCCLLDKDYYPVIEHTTEVLKRQPDNVKALFRRAKAHIGAWNPDEAKEDLHKVAQLDPSLSKSVARELHDLEAAQRAKNNADKEKLQGKMFS